MRPGARAEIDEKAERTWSHRVAHRGLDVAFGDMKRANAVPVGGVFFKERLHAAFALALQSVRAFAVPTQHRIVAVDFGDQSERQAAPREAIGDVEVDPAAVSEALDQPRLRQELQMAADAWLALIKDQRQVLDVEFACSEQQ